MEEKVKQREWDTAVAEVAETAARQSESDHVSTQREVEDRLFWSNLARELHDGVTQNVWYLQTELSGMSSRAQGGESLRADLERLKQVAQEAYRELRTTLDLLHARVVQKVNLSAELDELCEKFSEATRMDVEFRCSADARNVEVVGETGKQVRRLVQEALWNSQQHSQSESASVKMRRSRNNLVVMISDNGLGFSPEKVDVKHYGLRNMRERAEAINGKLYLTTSSGKGTTITLHVPV